MTGWRILLIMVLAAPYGVSAQAARGPQLGLGNGVSAQTGPNRSLLSLSGQVAPSHWQRGAIIGGLIGTAIGVLFYNAFEHETHGTIYVFVWAFGGAVVGGLIGAGSHKT